MCCAFHAHFLSIVQRTFIVPKIRKQWHTHKTKIGLGRIAPTLLDKSQNGWKARNMWTRLARTPFQKLSSYSFLSNVTTFGNVFFALGFLGRGKMKKKKKERNNSQLCLLSLRDTEIPLATLISALSAVDNILTEPTTIHHVILDDASVTFREDHHGVSRQPWVVESVVSWAAQAFTSRRHYWEVDVTESSSWMLGVSKDILIAILASVFILKKHLFYFLRRWTTIIVSSSIPCP